LEHCSKLNYSDEVSIQPCNPVGEFRPLNSFVPAKKLLFDSDHADENIGHGANRHVVDDCRMPTLKKRRCVSIQ